MKNNNNEQTNKEDFEIEKLCNEERYLDLNKHLESEALYQEEELKRFYAEQKEFGAVNLNYNENGNSDKNNDDNSQDSESKITEKNDNTIKLEAFVPSSKLELPVGMLIPETKKLNKIIEKTASFVASKGLQIEILIKTKQSSNSHFNFLSHDHHLNEYYKHLVDIIKKGKYTPKVDDSDNDDDNDSESNDDDDDDGNYLHPLLSKNIKNVNNTKPEFKPNINDSPYSELIKKFSHYSAKAQQAAEETANSSPKPLILDDGQNDENKKNQIDEPDEELRLVIDKLANYVARNGPKFEEIIKAKNESRFEFLNKNHKLNIYYQLKLNQFKKENSINDTKSENLNSPKIVKDKSTIQQKGIVDDYSNDDIENICSDLGSPSSNDERFTKEQKEKRKLKANIFLNMLNSTSKDDKNFNNNEINNKYESTTITSSSKDKKTLSRHRSRSRSRKRDSRSSSRSKRRHKKRYSSSRSRSRSRKSKYRKKSHRDSKHSRHKRSRSSSRHRHSHKSHRKTRRRKTKSRSRSRSRNRKSYSSSSSSLSRNSIDK